LDQYGYQGRGVFLDQGFSAGDFNQVAIIGSDFFQDLIKGHGPIVYICISCVAPRAVQVAPGQPDKNTGQPGKGGFTLEAVKDLANIQSQSNLLKG
jgi:hypothetical protein